MIALVSLAGEPVRAVDDARLDRLFGQLQEADPADARRIAGEIELELSKSGSPAMDLLLGRGRDALEAGDSAAAIGHLTALTDHAPDFAEGWHARALAYMQAGLLGPALADLERALALRPRHLGAIAALGALMEETGRPDLAHAAYARLLAIHPHHEDVSTALERLDPQVSGKEL